MSENQVLLDKAHLRADNKAMRYATKELIARHRAEFLTLYLEKMKAQKYSQ